MSEQKQTNEAVTTSQPAVQPQSERVPAGRKRKLVLLTVVFVLIALGFLLMYLLVWQHEESTDDAYVNGHLVQITPQITGTVQKVNVDDTQTVKAGQVLVELDNSDMQLA
ncbi:MAG: biotin/lipoyl-binding protein, partial [Snodgrassella alvi]|nr:biotin/lipoyl-binding protein [Snodgrassella alvi]